MAVSGNILLNNCWLFNGMQPLAYMLGDGSMRWRFQTVQYVAVIFQSAPSCDEKLYVEVPISILCLIPFPLSLILTVGNEGQGLLQNPPSSLSQQWRSQPIRCVIMYVMLTLPCLFISYEDKGWLCCGVCLQNTRPELVTGPLMLGYEGCDLSWNSHD